VSLGSPSVIESQDELRNVPENGGGRLSTAGIARSARRPAFCECERAYDPNPKDVKTDEFKEH
jgi:hypothetical protein